jgi:hypothetical protein
MEPTEQGQLVEAGYAMPAPAEPTSAPVAERMLMMAMQQQLPIESMERYVALFERQQAEQARRAFAAALAAAKAEMPIIYKDRVVKQTAKEAGKAAPSYRHATLSNITQTVNPVLGRHGLAVTWATSQEMVETETGGTAQRIHVTATLIHREGHSQSISMMAAPDTSGAKSPVQAIGSTITYLERYTYCALIGIAAQEPELEDDGGKGEEEVEHDEAWHELYAKLEAAALRGLRQYQALWQSLTVAERKAIGSATHEQLKTIGAAQPGSEQA